MTVCNGQARYILLEAGQMLGFKLCPERAWGKEWRNRYEEEVGIHRPSLNLGLGFGVNSQFTRPRAQDPQLERG